MHGEFSWIDLSTFDVAATESFYGEVFGWRFDEDTPGSRIITTAGGKIIAYDPQGAAFFVSPAL